MWYRLLSGNVVVKRVPGQYSAREYLYYVYRNGRSNMIKVCQDCNLPLFFFVHSNGETQGKICLKCKAIFEIKPFAYDNGNDYEEAILQRQEED